MDLSANIHPIVAQLEPSPEQIPAIVSRGKDIVVTAGAGTGKTRTLVARYLSFIAEGRPLRSIMAITFTKKAAREMRNRIREEVRSYLGKLAQDDPEYEFWRDIYQGLDASRISTIHSLAADILRQHPAEVKIDPRFELMDETLSARKKAQAVEAALGWASQDPLASVLLVEFGDWKLRRILGGILARSLDVQQALHSHKDNLWTSWLPILTDQIKKFIEDPLVVSGLNGLTSLEKNGLLQLAEQRGDLLVEDLRIVISLWKTISDAKQQEDWIEISRSLGPLRVHLKQKGRKENWAPADPRAIIKKIQPIYDELFGKQNIDLSVDQKLALEIIPALKSLFVYAFEWFAALKDQLHNLDFDDLENKSLQLLRDHPVVREYWQGQIQALLVDEYQDTNDRQRELLNLLNGDGKKLFIVGDGKQSIYRFRGADVAVFRQEQERINISGQRYHLSTSYRAHPDLLQALNVILEPVLGLDQNITYIEPFSSLLPGRQDNSCRVNPPYIELHLAAGVKAEGALQTAADALAVRLIELIGSSLGSSLPDGGLPKKPLSYGDVAVLCRASGSFSAYEAAFEKAGIPYQTISGQGFFERAEVRDVLNVLRAMVDPQDDLAAAGLMRSPAGGLSDAALVAIHDFQQSEHIQSLLEAARQIPREKIAEEHHRVSQLVELIDDLGQWVGRTTVAEILGRFLDQTGYLASLASLGLYRSVQNLKKLLSDAQADGAVSIPEFLHVIMELRDGAVRESEAQSISEGAVQIMSVHQAKGLEFPVIVLGDATKKERFSRDILLDKRFGMVLPFGEDQIQEGENGIPEIHKVSSLAYELAYQDEELREEAEANRLLYVAATRAQELLLINGVIGNPTKDNSLGTLGGWLGSLAESLGLNNLSESLEIDGNSGQQILLRSAGQEALLKIYQLETNFEFVPPLVEKHKLQELPPGFADFDLKTVADDLQPESWDSEEIPLRRVTSRAARPSAPAWVVGKIVHRALERWKFPSESKADFISWSEAEFLGLGLSEAIQIRDGTNRAVKILERFQDSELYKRMEKANQLKHELPFSLMGADGHPHTGLIDALFREGDRWILVEFKTDEIRSEQDFNNLWQKEDYQTQVAGYLFATEKLLGQRPEPILCFLNYDHQVHLVTDQWTKA